MYLSPQEKDKLLVVTAALLAERRLNRGLKLNHPEAVAWLSFQVLEGARDCLLYTSPSPRDGLLSRMPSSA